MNNPVDCSCS